MTCSGLHMEALPKRVAFVVPGEYKNGREISWCSISKRCRKIS